MIKIKSSKIHLINRYCDLNLHNSDTLVVPYLDKYLTDPKIQEHFHPKVNILSNLLY